jgi:bis(5'-nucleosidyl)-tetraphosphatase
VKKSEKKAIREFISLSISESLKHSRKRKAGIMVVKKFNDKWKPLALVWKGKIDIPKGKIEIGESSFEAAIRETHEESGISELDFKWGMAPLKILNLTIYLAATVEDPIVRPNPITGVKEHDYAKWVSWDKMSSGGSEKISIICDWARLKISQSDLL